MHCAFRYILSGIGSLKKSLILSLTEHKVWLQPHGREKAKRTAPLSQRTPEPMRSLFCVSCTSWGRLLFDEALISQLMQSFSVCDEVYFCLFSQFPNHCHLTENKKQLWTHRTSVHSNLSLTYSNHFTFLLSSTILTVFSGLCPWYAAAHCWEMFALVFAGTGLRWGIRWQAFIWI